MLLAKMLKPFTSQDSYNWHILWNSEEGQAGVRFLHFHPFLRYIKEITLLSDSNFTFKGIG